jgi:hypothetical protein
MGQRSCWADIGCKLYTARPDLLPYKQGRKRHTAVRPARAQDDQTQGAAGKQDEKNEQDLDAGRGQTRRQQAAHQQPHSLSDRRRSLNLSRVSLPH